MFCQKKKSRLQQMQRSAGDTLHSAQETLHGVLESTPERLEDWKQSAGDALHGASEALHGVVSTLGAKADALKSKAEALREQAEVSGASALDAARRMKDEREDQARAAVEGARRRVDHRVDKARDKARQRKDEFVVEHAPAIAVESGGEKWLWLLLGIGIGAALGVLFAPATGRRSRALLKDKLTRGAGAAEDLGEGVLGKAHDLSNRAQGAAHEYIAARSSDAGDVGDDVTIADRVRTELGRLEREFGLERINVDSCDGVVTLRGPVDEPSLAETIVTTAQKVAGVREVKNELAVEGDGETFVG